MLTLWLQVFTNLLLAWNLFFVQGPTNPERSWNSNSVMKVLESLVEYNISHGKSWKSPGIKKSIAVWFHMYSCTFFQIKALKLIKLIIFMRQLQYNAPNRMCVFHIFSRDDIPCPFNDGTQNQSLKFLPLKIVAAC